MWTIIKNWLFRLSFVERVYEVEMSLSDAKSLIQPLLIIEEEDTLELRSTTDQKTIFRIKIRKGHDART